MNREERRREEKKARNGGRSQRMIPPERHEAEVQDFMAGTIFVAGAAGIRADADGKPLPPLFIVLLDKNQLTPAPELLRLFSMLESQGTVKLNEQLAGTARWGTLPAADGQMLAKLELNLTSPVKTRPSLLLLADNYKEIWDIPATQGYLLGITTTEKFATLNDTSSYADALEICILLYPNASNAAQKLQDHYRAESQPPPDAPAVVIVNEENDDIRYQLGVTKNFLGQPEDAFMLVRPTGLTQIPMGAASVPSLIATTFAGHGLHWNHEGEPVAVAQGWSWEVRGRELIIATATGQLFASCELEFPGADTPWIQHVGDRGQFILHVGDELVMDDGTPPHEELKASRGRGNLVSGVIHHVISPETDGIPESEEPTQEPGARPWWKRVFRP